MKTVSVRRTGGSVESEVPLDISLKIGLIVVSDGAGALIRLKWTGGISGKIGNCM